MIKKFLLMCMTVTTIVFSLSPQGIYAESQKNSTLDTSAPFTVRNISQDKVIVLQNDNAYLLSSTNTIQLNNSKEYVTDVDIIQHPQKIVLLVTTPKNIILKKVFNWEGMQLSTQTFPIKKQIQTKWISPNQGLKEAVVTQDQSTNTIHYYSTSWSKPDYTFDTRLSAGDLEGYKLVDWDIQAFPYLVLKYRKDNIMDENYLFRVVDIKTKQYYTRKDWNTNFEYYISQSGKLSVYNSYTYSNHPAHVIRPEPGKEERYYTQINLKDGKQSAVLNNTFSYSEKDESGWKSNVVGDLFIIKDILAETYSLYQLDGKLLISDQRWNWPENSVISSYNPNEGIISVVSPSSGKLKILQYNLK